VGLGVADGHPAAERPRILSSKPASGRDYFREK
jgi:hypothetical protein